jgi:tetratricopeptide (TPR) repeat protein/transcriptional regulator with XRE-family HTH domain
MRTGSSARGIILDAQKLRDLRRQRGMTQAHLADAAEVSDDTISRAERGQAISLENAMAVAAFFDTTVAALAEAVAKIEAPTPRHEPPSSAASNIPIRVPVHFMGREEALADIETAMGRYHGRVAITALHGLRGVGKTVLAAAYAERHRGDYRATWWLRAETEAGMRADLVGLGVRLGWVGADDKEEPALAAIIERLGHEGDGILLIFDNAVDADSLTRYLPRGGAARVLVTSNYHAWRGTAEPVEIRLWPKEIGADYLIARTGQPAPAKAGGERTAAEDLSVALGGLPLAHEQAAAYCERLDLSLAEYARRFAAEPARLLDTDKDAPAGYHDKQTVTKTFALAIDAAVKLHQAAEPLIVHAALLAPEPIPLFLFAEGRKELGEPLSSLLAGDGLDEAVAALRAFALIDRETIPDERDPAITTDTIRLHRLVREVAAAKRIGDAREDVRSALVTAMATVYPRDVDDDPNTWPRARRLDALALNLVGGDAPLPDGTEEPAGLLMHKLATYRRYALADYAAGRPLFERTLAISEKMLGPEHHKTMIGLGSLAELLLLQGDSAAARPLFERALAIGVKVLGPENPNNAACLHSLAFLIEAQGDFPAAKPLYERALAIREKTLGPNHTATAQSLDCLARVLYQQGDLVGALQFSERALAIHEKMVGPEHPDTATNLDNLARLLQAQGDLAGARRLIERALTIYEKVLGSGHHLTAISLNNLATVLLQQGDLAGARPLVERALATLEEVLGPEHPNTVGVRRNLAILIARGG